MKALSILANWALSALVIFMLAEYVDGFSVDTYQTALIVALVLGIFNAVIRPILTILTLPINLVTFGLFSFVISAVLIMATDYFVTGFTVTSFVPALIAAVALWIINVVLSAVMFPVKVIPKP